VGFGGDRMRKQARAREKMKEEKVNSNPSRKYIPKSIVYHPYEI